MDLGSNKITEVNESFPPSLQKTLIEINLSKNPFSCVPCHNTWFKSWRETSNIKFVGWPNHYKCGSPPNKAGTPFIEYKATDEDCKPADPMTIAIASTGSFLLIVFIFGIAGYKGRWYIWYHCFIKYRRKLACGLNDDPERQQLLDEDVRYDVYIIYHDQDRQFVLGALSKFMEEEHGYKLYVWDKEFEAGAKVDIIVDNIYRSNHVIAIISKHFLKDPWCDFQLNVALDRQIELKRQYLTLITLEDVDRQLLSKSWCVLLTKTPTVEWCERKNDIKRKLFERQILTNIPRKASSRTSTDEPPQ